MSLTNNYSFDLETLGTKYNSYIIAIGCVQFNSDTGESVEEFYIKTKCSNDFKIDLNTVKWWLGQSEEARREFSRFDNKEMRIYDALECLSEFVNSEGEVWGNGATFDIGILDYAYDICNMETPWNFRNIRDLRTIKALALEKGYSEEIKFEGEKHNALADAKHQAKLIAAYCNYLLV